MFIALLVIVALFQILTGGKLLLPMNIAGLILQKQLHDLFGCGYVFCILTGNVDLAVGATLDFLARLRLVNCTPRVEHVAWYVTCIVSRNLLVLFRDFYIKVKKFLPLLQHLQEC